MSVRESEAVLRAASVHIARVLEKAAHQGQEGINSALRGLEKLSMTYDANRRGGIPWCLPNVLRETAPNLEDDFIQAIEEIVQQQLRTPQHVRRLNQESHDPSPP